jgi:tetratricopeptide (TPR) repeat protein
MLHAPHISRRALAALAISLMFGGCAYSIPEVDPADLPGIRRQLANNPASTDLQVQLGMALYKTDDFEAARMTLQAAVDSGNQSGPGLLYLGMVHEELGNWTAASDAYNQYLSVGRSEELKNELRDRLQLVAQNMLQERAQTALANEAQLLAADPLPRSVAVMPFAYNSTDPNLEPLIYALADMMTTDFAVSNALVVLERAQMQTLLDEIGLSDAGYSEPGTGARAGRLLQAEHVVQGVLTPAGDNVSVAQDVLNVPSASSAGQVNETAALEDIFDMEKQLVFRTIQEVLGVTLTPGEQQQILDNRTDNVLAFLAYGRGLREKDSGNYAAAQAEFQQAQQLDPDFAAAATEATETAVMDDAATTTTAEIATTAAATGETTSSGAVAPPTTTTTGATTSSSSSTTQTAQTLSGASEAVNPTPTSQTIDLGSTQQSDNQTQQTTSEDRSDAVQESQGQENVTTAATAQIRIVIRRPGGGGQ